MDVLIEVDDYKLGEEFPLAFNVVHAGLSDQLVVVLVALVDLVGYCSKQAIAVSLDISYLHAFQGKHPPELVLLFSSLSQLFKNLFLLLFAQSVEFLLLLFCQVAGVIPLQQLLSFVPPCELLAVCLFKSSSTIGS